MKRRTQWIWVTCLQCGRDFPVPPHRSKTAKYHNLRCSQKAKAKQASESRRGSGDGRYVKQSGRRQHRIVAEQKLGRPMTPNEVVHHIDGNGHNNHPSNILVMTRAQHTSLHNRKMLLARKRKHGY